MNHAFIARWTRIPRSIGRLSVLASSHHSLSSAAFIINIAESDFRYTQDAKFFESWRRRFDRCLESPRGAVRDRVRIKVLNQ
jgi:hypothetical protein